MRVYETRVVTPRPRKERFLKERRCDLCNRKGPVGFHDDEDWDGGLYEFDEVVVKRSHGECYPDCEGTRTTQSFDVCPGCFESVLVPFFESKGAEPHEEEES